MALEERQVTRFVIPEMQFKTFIANQLQISPNDIDHIGLTDNDTSWEVVMKEILI
ncbi:hypothetical protein LCGC14_2614440 [marine sediment metagenome]|uniref:Uncharacterized protein n=1 Tax=marine sediment metagenome TaxID=412755 RepID=A0A0F9ASK5_9ZZZZ